MTVVENQHLKKKIRFSKQNVRRKNKNIQTMNDLLKELQDDEYITSEVYEWLQHICSGIKLAILKHEIDNCNKRPHALRYSDTALLFP